MNAVSEVRTSNRASMPTVAAMVDELRAQGISVKVLYASENGVTVGKKPPRATEVFNIPLGYRMTVADLSRIKADRAEVANAN